MQAQEGLRSAVEKGGFDVRLLSYQRPASIPPGVTVMLCDDLLPRSSYSAARKHGGLSPQTLADVICAKACQKESGWIIDPASIWVASVDSLAACHQNSMFVDGHLFASVAAAEGYCPVEDPHDVFRWWLLNYLKAPGDEFMLRQPWRLPRTSPLLDAFLDWADRAMAPARRIRSKSSQVKSSSTEDFSPAPSPGQDPFPAAARHTPHTIPLHQAGRQAGRQPASQPASHPPKCPPPIAGDDQLDSHMGIGRGCARACEVWRVGGLSPCEDVSRHD